MRKPISFVDRRSLNNQKEKKIDPKQCIFLKKISKQENKIAKSYIMLGQKWEKYKV